MNTFIRSTLTLAVLFSVELETNSLAQFPGEGQSTVVVIQSDGSCQTTNVTTAPRTLLEQQVRMMERVQNMEFGETPSTIASDTATNTLSDQELIQKLKAMREDERFGAGSGGNLGVTITNGTVRMELTHSFASIEEMLKDRTALATEMVTFQNTRFELDTNGQLRVTFTPTPGMQRYVRSMRSAARMAGAKGSFRLILPGKVLTSGFPEIQDRMTGFSFDSKDDSSMDALAKLYEAPTVVTAEAGGLKLPQPLESRTLQRASRSRGEMGDDLPITDAAGGFVAEAQSLTTTTLHVFPEGRDYFERSGGYFGQRTGAVVSAKLFAPKGRTLQSVSDVRVLKATDDKGRTIAPAEAEEGYTRYSSGSSKENSTLIELRLRLPLADAQAINELNAEAVVLTAGAWKETTITNLQENATNEIDLASVLPGAKLVITKFNSKNRQISIEAQVKGPPTVRRLEFEAKLPGTEQMSSSAYERRFSTSQGVSTRGITISAYQFNDGRQGGAPLVLVVRYPEDLKRERVKFKLSGLDLL